MSLFKTKKKTQATTSVSRAVQDEDIVPTAKMAILNYVMSADSATSRVDANSITDYIISASSNSPVNRAKKAQRYSAKEGYAYGELKTNMVSQVGVDVKGAITDELERIYPEGVLVTDAYFGPMNNFYFLRPILWQKYGYNYDTNELVNESIENGFPTYMESAVIKYSKYSTEAQIDPDTLVQHGPSAESGYTPFRPANPKALHVPWINNYEGDHDVATITAVYKNAAGTKVTYTFDIDFLDYEASSKPIDVGLDDSDTDNIEPDAVTPIQPDTLDGKDFYQANYTFIEEGVERVGVFIYLYGSGINPRLDNLFSLTSRFGQYIPRTYARMNGMKCNDESLKGTDKYKAMVGLGRRQGMQWSSWVDEIHKSVGSVGQVTQIFMTHALPANTTDPLIQRYLYEYWLDLYGRIPDKFATSEFRDLKVDMLAYGSKEGQSIVIADDVYSQSVNFSSIGFIDRTGNIGPVGTMQSGMGTDIVVMGRPTSIYRPRSAITYHYYRKQVTPTTYREVRVYGLAVIEYVQGGVSTTASGGAENLLIPLDMSINHEFNNRQLDELYTKAMYIVLNTVQVVKTKWYQTGIFKAIMFVVAVVIGYFFPPAGVAAMTWLAAAYAVVYAVAINIVIKLAVKILVNIGVDVGIVAAVAAIVAAVLGAYGSIRDITVAGFSAPQLISAANQAFALSAQGYAQQAKETLKEYVSLFADLTKEQKELQQKYKDLGVAGDSVLLMFEPPMSIGVRMGESTEDYYARSVHTSNVGTAVYYALENQVNNSLMLPTRESILNKLQERTDELSVS